MPGIFSINRIVNTNASTKQNQSKIMFIDRNKIPKNQKNVGKDEKQTTANKIKIEICGALSTICGRRIKIIAKLNIKSAELGTSSEGFLT